MAEGIEQIPEKKKRIRNRAKTEKNEFGGYGSCGNFAHRTKEELSEFGKIGGKKSGETKRRKKAMREALEILLDLPLKNGKCYSAESIQSFADLKGKNISVSDAMLIAQIQRALKGDTTAFSVLRDTAGQKPVEKVDMNVDSSEKFADIVDQIGGEGLEE